MSQYFEAHISDESRDEMCDLRMHMYIRRIFIQETALSLRYLFKKLHSPWELMSDNYDIYSKSIYDEMCMRNSRISSCDSSLICASNCQYRKDRTWLHPLYMIKKKCQSVQNSLSKPLPTIQIIYKLYIIIYVTSNV